MLVNGVEAEEFAGLTVQELIAAKGIVPRGVAVALNGTVVRRSEWALVRVAQGDAIEIVTAVAGG